MTSRITFRPYVVNHSSAQMPSSVHARYRHGAIMKMDGATDHRFVAPFHGSRTIEYSGNLHADGKHSDAFSRWLAHAVTKCKLLNDRHEIELMTALGCAAWQIDSARDNQGRGE
jgi:hypothetical protein